MTTLVKQFIPVALFLLWSGIASGFCIESPGREITAGELPREELKYLLNVLASHPEDTRLFVVQRGRGHYIKMCDEADQISAFEDKYRTGSSSWQNCRPVCGDQVYEILGRDGEHRIMQAPGGCWSVCE